MIRLNQISSGQKVQVPASRETADAEVDRGHAADAGTDAASPEVHEDARVADVS